MNTTSEMLPEVRGRLGERLGIVCTCNKKINTITTVKKKLIINMNPVMRVITKPTSNIILDKPVHKLKTIKFKKLVN